MSKKYSGGNGTLIILILAVVVVGAVMVLVTKNNGTVAPTPAPQFQATTGNSNTDLQQDMTSVDSSLNTTSQSTTNVNQGINDTPVVQPNY